MNAGPMARGNTGESPQTEIGMASKVNVKFVASLAVGLVVLVGVLGLAAYFLLVNTPADLIRKGDQAMAKQDYPSAIAFYSKAVNKDRTNLAYLRKWRDAISAGEPDSRVKFVDEYRDWVSIARQMAIVQHDNLEDQVAYAEIVRQQYLSGPNSREANKLAISELDTLIGYYSGKPAGPWEKLKKYRGLAKLRTVSAAADATDQQWKDALDDLQAAVKADPSDSEAALTLVSYYGLQANKADRNEDHDKSDALLASARKVEEDFLAHNSGSPIMQLSLVKFDLESAIRKFALENKNLGPGQTPPDPLAASKAFVDKAKPEFEKASDAAMALPPDKIDMSLLTLHRQLEETLSTSTHLTKTEALMTRALEKRPKDAALLMFKADLLSERDDYPQAIATAEQVINLPMLPVGTDGVALFAQKDLSRFLRVLWGVKQIAAAPAADHDALMQRLHQYRQDMAANESQDSPRLALADAWVASADEQWDRSDRLLDQFSRTNRISDVDTLLLWANVALKRGQTGKAEDRLRQALAIAPQNIPASIALAELNIQLQNPTTAVSIYESLLRLQPGNSDLAKRLERARALAGVGTSSDPVLQTLIDADKLSRPGSGSDEGPEQVAKFLEDAVKKLPPDERLYGALAGAYINAGSRDKAGQTIKAGLSKFPDSSRLKAMDLQLNSDDPLAASLFMIDQANQTDLEKVLARYSIFQAAGRKEDAQKEMKKAVALKPDDAKVVEIEFLDALDRHDMAEATKFAEQAAKVNADHLDGKTFQARLLASKGDFEGAVKLMQDVISQGAPQPETWRLLGRFQAQLGRAADAAASFREALKQRPDDSGAANDLIDALASAGQRDQALLVARECQKFPTVAGNRDFVERWLSLEQDVGDRNVARQQREVIARSDPKNRGNLTALAQIYLDVREFDKARAMIDRIRAAGDDIESVRLDADYAWAKGDADKAGKLFQDFIAARKGRDQLIAQLGYAQFLLTHGQADEALKVMDQARANQDPKALEADRAIADSTFRMGRYAVSAEATRRVMAVMGDGDDHLLRKRLVETLSRQGDYAGAEKELAPLLAERSPDAVSLLLDADIKVGQKDAQGARKMLDRAVSSFPNESSVFVKRGQFLMSDQATIKDAIEDFSRAIQLSPNSAQIYRLRAAAYGSMKGTSDSDRLANVDKAIADWRKAVELNPGDDQQLTDFVVRLVTLGREQDAEAIADEALAARPQSPKLLGDIGDMFQSLRKQKQAAKYFQKSFDLDLTNNGVAQRLLDAYLSPQVQDLTAAEKVLATLGQPRIDSNPGFLLAAAKLRMAQGRKAEAGRFAVSSLQLLDPAQPSQMIAWHNDMQLLIPVASSHIDFLDDLIKRGSVPKANEWMRYFRLLLASDDKALHEEATKQMGVLASSAQGPEARLFARRAHGAFLFGDKKYEEAAASMAQGLKEFPEDTELLNNYSFLLAKYLNKPADALPLAQKLAEVIKPVNNPQSELLDSIGYVYLANQKYQDAAGYLQAAINAARSDRAAISASVHLSQALLGLGKKDEAKRALQAAENLMDSGRQEIPDRDELKADLEAVKAELGK